MGIAVAVVEQSLSHTFLLETQTYIEFGTGGSTILADQSVTANAESIHSSREWQEKFLAMYASEMASKLQLVHVDIGPLKERG